MSHQVRWTAQKIAQRLALIEPLVYRRRQAIAPFACKTLSSPLEDPAPFVGPLVDDGNWPVLPPHTYWGAPKTDFVFRSHFQVPTEWDHERPIVLHLSSASGNFLQPEAILYVDGVAYATFDQRHHEVLLRPEWHDGQPHTLALHGWTGDGEEYSKLQIHEWEIAQIDQPTRDFLTTARVALGTANVLTENNPVRGKLLSALNSAFTVLDLREPFGEAFYASVAPAHEILRQQIGESGHPLDVEIFATGHAHIDVAWLWSLGQTRRKAGRSFYTVHRLMEQFPDYHFTQSQPQLYDFVRQDYPELFQAIKQRVQEGRWEPIGGMWVEADCNLTGPESLARQFLLGRGFFTEHFGPGAETPVLWLPDVFGYAWALPQLIKQAGLKYFFTIKIGWSQYNRLPYDSFWWQGVDGTRILTHFGTTPSPNPAFGSAYNATATPWETMGTWTRFMQKDSGHGKITPPLMMAYGFGDGGGGPTHEMLENIQEMNEFPELPRIHQGSMNDFFHKLETQNGAELPTWNGELYLEYHRGTYTTQSRNKRANRKSEFLLHDAEFLATLASSLDATYRYPSQAFHQAWQLICLNQFHDIIPGSSIHEVYVESQQQYELIKQLGTEARRDALQSIAQQIDGDLLLINATSFAREDLAFWPGQLPAGHVFSNAATGEPVFIQSGAHGTLIAAGQLPPTSVTALKLGNANAQHGPAPETGLTATSTLLENQFVRVELDTAGDITRIYDKVAHRDVLPEGTRANQFQAFEDRPLDYEAWDIDIFYDEKQWFAEPATSVRVVETGPLRATLEVERRILHSSYTQRISLSYNSPQLDIETTIDWRERHILLKVAFPVEILSPVATYEIQWGNVQRTTHRNTSWDWARFETCAQKWVDLSEGGYGVSILNDCKYGHDIKENVIRVSLLRSPTWPDPEADQGEHRFTYSILPHAGSWNELTIGAAYTLNDPIIVHESNGTATEATSSLRQLSSFVKADQPNIVIETIKQAEDGKGIIVRLYESQRKRGPITLTTGFDLAAAWHTNLLEQNETELAVSGRSVSLAVHPYEIVTLRLVPA